MGRRRESHFALAHLPLFFILFLFTYFSPQHTELMLAAYSANEAGSHDPDGVVLLWNVNTFFQVACIYILKIILLTV
jgi:hypothetical protein